MLSGHIPPKLTLFSRPAEEIINRFESFKEEINKLEVYPTFIADSANEKNLESGKQWAKGGYSSRGKFTQLEVDNQPITGIRIVGLEHRSEGGRAYKILFHDYYYADLREDVLLDLILEEGIRKGGILNGEYVWARVGSQMKLVRVGSKLYGAILRSMEYREKPKISLKDLEPGRVYIDKTGDKYLYLGRFETTKFDYAEGITDYYYDNGYYLGRPVVASNFQHKKVKLHVIMSLDRNESWHWKYSTFKTITFKDKGDKMEIPKDWQKDLRKKMDKTFKERPPQDLKDYVYYSELANMGGLHPLYQDLID